MSIGTTWGKWDLHVHTPSSIIQNYGADNWDRFLDELGNLDPAFHVIGVNDYLFLDGYIQVRDSFLSGHLSNLDAVFPVIELRLDQLAGAPEELRRINYHVIFDPDLDPRMIQQQFLNGLSTSYHLNPNLPDEVSWSQVITRASLEELGRSIRKHTPEPALSTLPKSDLKLGFNNISFSLDDIGDILARPQFEGGFLTAIGRAEWAAMQWTEQAVGIKKTVINKADLIFTASESPSAHKKAQAKLAEMGVNSRLIDCSDAHWFSDSKEKDRIGNCQTWINATPTMRGLQHAITEFNERVFVGLEPTKLISLRKKPSHHAATLRITKRPDSSTSSSYFDTDISLNPGFVAIVGNKGNGKSALLDIIGLLTNSRNYPDFTFLSPLRFLEPRSNPAQHFQAEMRWHSDEVHTRELDSQPPKDEVERSSYLPQQLIDDICQPEITSAGERFNEALEAVLFSHVPTEDRLGETTFAGLVARQTQAIESRLAALRGELAEINQQIVDLEEGTKPNRRTTLESELVDIKSRLAQLESNPPADPEEHANSTPAVESVKEALDTLREQKESLLEEQAEVQSDLAQLATKIDDLRQVRVAMQTLQEQTDRFLSQYSESIRNVGLDPNQLLMVSFDTDLLKEKVAELEQERAELRDHLSGEDDASVARRLQALQTKIEDTEANLDLQSRQYAEAIRVKSDWEESIRSLREGTRETRGVAQVEKDLEELKSIPTKLKNLQAIRLKKSEFIHHALLQIVQIYENLYSPARDFIDNHELGDRAELEFAATLREHDFVSTFFSMIGRNVTGTFYGDEASERLEGLVDRADFGSSTSAIEFAQQLDHSTHFDERDGQEKPVDVDRLIRKGHSLEGLYNFLYGFDYLEAHYVLQFSGVPVSRLSPGQKGTLLLMFYLLVDPPVRPLLLDQPDENLDNQTIMKLLVPALKEAKRHRQVFVITHNPNVAIVADADQVIVAKKEGETFKYNSGAIEDPDINRNIVDVLEGTWEAFDNRRRKYIPRLLVTTS